MAMLEARPYRPFKSSEEYLEAMKEDLAEWLSTLYPNLNIKAENFMDRLDTGVALCKHANYVRQAAEDYLARRQARNKSMTRSMTSGSAGPILAMGNVHYLPAAKSGTFFARDNVSNFITWCRKSLKIIECLLFETDDLIMRKNEKHVILCLLEVARRGAKFGMLAPMLVQMERQIDREIAADNKANGIGCGTQTDNADATGTQTEIGINTDNVATETDMFDSDSENEDDDDNSPMLMYGPQPQIITNDLKSLDEMVRDLVEKCTCPSQFPMVRVSEGKYRIGDTKVLIFVRILRSHVMVRVGGGWDTLAHYLDKHDPCRCKAQHRSSIAARLVPRTTNQNNGGIELHKAQVIYERSPPSTRKIISSFNNQAAGNASVTSSPISNNNSYNLSPNFGNNNKQTSRSPTPQRKFLNHHNTSNTTDGAIGEKLLTANGTNGTNGTSTLLPSPNLARRSMSPSPRRLIDVRKKQNSLDSNNGSGPKSLPICSEAVGNNIQFDGLNYTAGQTESGATQAGTGQSDGNTNGTSNKFENISDNGSEISDEGYRSLGVIQSNAQKRESLHSQASVEDAESNARLDQTSSDSQLSPVDDLTISNKAADILGSNFHGAPISLSMDAGPQSLPAVLTTPTQNSSQMNVSDIFERSGIFITDDEITVDVANSTGLRKTGFANKIFGGEDVTDNSVISNKEPKANPGKSSKIPRSPVAQRRRSLDNSNCSSASMQDISTRTGLPVFNRKQPLYRSVRRPVIEINRNSNKISAAATTRKSTTPPVHEVTNTWSGRALAGKKRPTLNADTFTTNNGVATPGTGNTFDRNIRTRSSQILYDSNGRRVRGCTASLTTSPVKNYNTSPLAQQLLEAASSAKNDAQILQKMKVLLSRYSTNSNGSNSGVTNTKTPPGGTSNNKKPVYEDFTSAWVHSNGNLERSNSCSPPTKSLSKRSSAASSTESTQSREVATVIVSPRRDRGLSKIPAPTRQHTELY